MGLSSGKVGVAHHKISKREISVWALFKFYLASLSKRYTLKWTGNKVLSKRNILLLAK